MARLIAAVVALLCGSALAQSVIDGPTLDLWRRAEQGDAEAQYRLAQKFDEGGDLPTDPARAYHWYRRAATQGHTGAQVVLGRAYDGAGQKDVAIRWYTEAARRGEPRAHLELGRIHEERGEKELAAAWFAQAARGGVHTAPAECRELERVVEDATYKITIAGIYCLESDGLWHLQRGKRTK